MPTITERLRNAPRQAPATLSDYCVADLSCMGGDELRALNTPQLEELMNMAIAIDAAAEAARASYYWAVSEPWKE